MMAVGGGTTVARQMLQHRQHAALHQPFGDRRRDCGDLFGTRAVGAIADHRIGLAHRNVGKRQAIDRDADIREIGRDQPRAEARRMQSRLRIAVIECAVMRARRISRPVRRSEPLHAPALLID